MGEGVTRLKPGQMPRGTRPYVFVGDSEHEPVPGTFVKPGSVVSPTDAAWIFAGEGLQVARGPAEPTLSEPEDARLFPYQRAGAGFLLASDWALLGDEMGLGKTAQALIAAEHRLNAEAVQGQAVLILCPALAKHHWAREVRRWTGCSSTILESLRPGQLRGDRYVIANYDILYGQRRRDAAGKLNDSEHLPGWGKTLAAMEFPIVICDEAHMLRGKGSRRSKAVKEVAKNSTCVWLLSGTPMPNHVRDLWALWDLASDGLAGPYWPWVQAYADAKKGQYGWTADGATRVEELRNRLSFWVLGRTKSEVGLQLPPFRREVVPVDVTLTRDPVGGAPSTQQGAVDSALRRTARAKQPAIMEMAAEAALAGQKVVVFVYLREAAENIAGGLPDTVKATYAVTGGMSPEQRDLAAKAFREREGGAVFVATIDSVGVAISLVGTDLVIFGDLSYEPAKLLQAEGRVHRIGSTSPVLVRYVTAAGTIDDAVIETVVSKLDIQHEVFGEAESTKTLQSSLGYTKPDTSAIVAALFDRLVNGQ